MHISLAPYKFGTNMSVFKTAIEDALWSLSFLTVSYLTFIHYHNKLCYSRRDRHENQSKMRKLNSCRK